jgi:hypothetical protein
VIDYQVLYAEVSSEAYNLYSENLAIASETVTGLTPGVSYKFIVRSRNVIGLSTDSGSVTILAA